jgi:hypothetical protein
MNEWWHSGYEIFTMKIANTRNNKKYISKKHVLVQNYEERKKMIDKF